MGPGVPGSSCTKNQESVLLGPLPPSSPSEICGACASRGSGGSWFMRLMTSSMVACMSVPTANFRLRKALPWFANAFSDCMPRRPCSARSCGSMISDSISAGAAARQLVKIEITGSSMFGNSWMGSLTSANTPSSATMRMATSTPAGFRSEISVRFMAVILAPRLVAPRLAPRYGLGTGRRAEVYTLRRGAMSAGLTRCSARDT